MKPCYIRVTKGIQYRGNLGPPKLTCYSESFFSAHYNKSLDIGCKNNKMQRNFKLGDQKNDYGIARFCYVSVRYNESPL